MWTYTDDYSILPNLYIRSIFKDGVFKWYEIYPCEGYVLRAAYLDGWLTDEEGNLVLDENDNPILVPYYSGGGAMVGGNYDWEANPNGYAAELYEEGMVVNGGVNPPIEKA